MFAEVNGVRLHYDEAGEGEPVVLLAGFGSNRRFWKGMQPLLTGCRCIMPDNRGVGETEYEGRVSIDDMADDVYLLARSLGLDRVHVVGWSMGSHIAQAFAYRHPEAVVSLTVVSTYLRRPARSAYFLGRLVQMAVDGRATLDALYTAVNAFCYTEETFRQAEESGTEVPVPRKPMDPNRLMDQLLAVDGFDPVRILPSISVPTLVVQGTEDIMTDFSEGEAVANGIPGARLFAVEGAGHIIPPQDYAGELLRHIVGNGTLRGRVPPETSS